jgi:hypothetical protein
VPRLLAPLLEEARSLTPAVCAPQVAATGAVVATIVGPMVAAASLADA